MKLLFLFGDSAVGKMTVGQRLAKITDLKLFHNHMTIEPVLEIFGYYDPKIVLRLRQVIFEEFAKSENYGMIFTFMWAFNQKEDWQYVENIKSIFAPFGTEFYYVELDASKEARLERNKSENRLNNKPSKRDVKASEKRMLAGEEKYRCESLDGEIPFENFLKIDNTHLSPSAAAKLIKENFNL